MRSGCSAGVDGISAISADARRNLPAHLANAPKGDAPEDSAICGDGGGAVAASRRLRRARPPLSTARLSTPPARPADAELAVRHDWPRRLDLSRDRWRLRDSIAGCRAFPDRYASLAGRGADVPIPAAPLVLSSEARVCPPKAAGDAGRGLRLKCRLGIFALIASRFSEV